MDIAEGNQTQDLSPAIQAQPEVVPEKLITQSELNRIVGDQKREASARAYERGRSEALAAMQQQAQQSQGAQQNEQVGMGGMQQMSDDKIRQLIAEEAQRRAQEELAHQTVSNFVQKMEMGKTKHPDFEKTVAKLGDLKNLTHIIQLAANVDNTHDVMYHLGQNPSKVATLTTLAYVNPHLAQQEMLGLSQSLKTNEAAANVPDVNEPLSRTKPSTIGTDNGEMTIRDLKKQSWARG